VSSAFSEKQVHDAMYAKGGLESFVQDSPEIEKALEEADYTPPKIDPRSIPARISSFGNS
jgi:hypothetical protein